MNIFMRVLVGFLAITGAVALVTGFGEFEFGQADFWDHHGLVFLAAIAFFPRLTLLFSSVPFGGILWWAGWLFAPRLLVAVLATFAYWHQNPILVVIAWLIALGGESSEKYVVVQRSGGRRRGFERAKWVSSDSE